MADEKDEKPKLSDKRWVLRHVLVPVLLACVPVYGAWTLAEAEGQTKCKIETEANKIIVTALLEQLKVSAEAAHAATHVQPTPLPVPMIAPPALPDIVASESHAELARRIEESLKHRVPNASAEQTQLPAQRILVTLDEADLPPETKGRVYELVREAARKK